MKTNNCIKLFHFGSLRSNAFERPSWSMEAQVLADKLGISRPTNSMNVRQIMT